MKAQASQSVAREDEGLAFDGLDGLLGFRLRVAHGAMNRDFIASLASIDISQRQTGALWLVGANPGVSQTDLAEALSTDPATMVALIDRLEADGRMIRTRSAQDRRRVALHLTPKGAKALAAAKRAIARHERKFEEMLGAKDFATLMQCLAKISAMGGGA